MSIELEAELSSRRNLELRNLPYLGPKIQQFDNTIGERGLVQAARGVIGEADTKLKVNGKDEEVKEVLSQEGILLVANHPYDTDPIPLLAALEPRKDIFVVGHSLFLGVGPNFTDHLLPVSPSTPSKKLSVRFGEILKKGGVQFEPEISDSEARRRTLQSLWAAAREIKDGGMVIILPQGLGGRKEKWFSGVGHILKEIGLENNAYLLLAHVGGTSNFDFLRFAPGIRRILPSFKVTFAHPRLIREVLGQPENETSPKEITRNLEEQYHHWTQSLRS